MCFVNDNYFKVKNVAKDNDMNSQKNELPAIRNLSPFQLCTFQISSYFFLYLRFRIAQVL